MTTLEISGAVVVWAGAFVDASVYWAKKFEHDTLNGDGAAFVLGVSYACLAPLWFLFRLSLLRAGLSEPGTVGTKEWRQNRRAKRDEATARIARAKADEAEAIRALAKALGIDGEED